MTDTEKINELTEKINELTKQYKQLRNDLDKEKYKVKWSNYYHDNKERINELRTALKKEKKRLYNKTH